MQNAALPSSWHGLKYFYGMSPASTSSSLLGRGKSYGLLGESDLLGYCSSGFDSRKFPVPI
jgi:hypothetical protein